ncbi:MAG: polysaccharide deacetylase family protein [candidate division WOR-3 bacterium]|nr:MAG: polysaccharide deacetylase family protein [candidate division WOR-3 bacterium]
MVKAIQFHRVTPKVQLCGTWNYPGQFENFIRFIHRDFSVVMPGDDRDGLVITFDDGDRSVYEYAFPVLKRHGVRAVVFLIVDYIGKDDLWDITLSGKRSAHLTWDEICEMKEWGIEFGSHTLTHRNLTLLTAADVAYELSESKSVLEKRIGPVRCISYPFNRVNRQIVRFAKKAGYQYGFGGAGNNDLLIKKEAVYITDNIVSLNTKIRERPWVLYRYDRLKQQIINYFTMITMLIKR